MGNFKSTKKAQPTPKPILKCCIDGCDEYRDDIGYYIFCNKHHCQYRACDHFVNVHEGKLTNACLKHTCDRDNCLNVRSYDFRYCIKHQCRICNALIDGTCSKCMCPMEGCFNNKPISSASSCKEHQCKNWSCHRIIANYNTKYCTEHKCKECNNEHISKAQYCNRCISKIVLAADPQPPPYEQSCK